MNLRLAYVDHQPLKSFLEALANVGIENRPYNSINEFIKVNDFLNFSAFLCHPGLAGQTEFSEIVRNYPHLRAAMITDWDYEYTESDIPVFSYEHPESVIKWITENK